MRRAGAILVAVLAAGCQQKMADQPAYRPLEPSTFFADGQSARPLPRGVVAREWAASTDPTTSGLKPEFRRGPASPAGDPAANPNTPPPGAPSDPSKFADEFPFELTRADLDRGQERYTIFCAICHGPLGDGTGKIPERGYVRPPNYYTDPSRGFARYDKAVLLRDVPVGYLFEVITRGYGAMPRYGPQIAAADRWRIAAYVRALQLSRHASLADLPASEQAAARKALGGQP